MKRIIFITALSTTLVMLILTSCQSPSEKIKNAENKLQDAQFEVVKAKIELIKTQRDSITEFQKFRNESAEKMIEYDKNIADFKARVANERKENKVRYENTLAELEQQNRDMKKKLAEYKDDGKTDWEKFKVEFNHDMDELGNAFKDFNVKNVK